LEFCTLKHAVQSGGTVGISLGIAAYLAVATLFIRFIHVTHQCDEDMSRITAEWIEQTSRGGVAS
jgi:hypothetical protein